MALAESIPPCLASNRLPARRRPLGGGAWGTAGHGCESAANGAGTPTRRSKPADARADPALYGAKHPTVCRGEDQVHRWEHLVGVEERRPVDRAGVGYGTASCAADPARVDIHNGREQHFSERPAGGATRLRAARKLSSTSTWPRSPSQPCRSISARWRCSIARRGLVGVQLHLPLKLASRDAKRAVDRPPSCGESHSQRRLGLVEDGAHRHREAPGTASAAAAQPVAVVQKRPIGGEPDNQV